MGKFDIYKEKVTLNTTAGKDQEYVLVPVGGDQIDKIFSFVMKLESATPSDAENMSDEEKTQLMVKNLDEDGIRKLRSMVSETLKASYPNEDENALELFAQQNMFVFMEPCLNANMGKLENITEDRAMKGKLENKSD